MDALAHGARPARLHVLGRDQLGAAAMAGHVEARCFERTPCRRQASEPRTVRWSGRSARSGGSTSGPVTDSDPLALLRRPTHSRHRAPVAPPSEHRSAPTDRSPSPARGRTKGDPMTGSSDIPPYSSTEPERVGRALIAMRERRAKLRRARVIGVSGVFVVAITAATVAVLSNGGHHVVVVSPSPATTEATATVGSTTTTSQSTTSIVASTTTTSQSTSSTAAITTLSVAGTQILTYQPFTAGGVIDPSLQITSTVTGTCTSGAALHAYRCFGANPANGTYDPCFAGPSGPATVTGSP